MFCLYCTNYKNLDEPCKKGIRMTDIKSMIECKHYTYNKEVKKQ